MARRSRPFASLVHALCLSVFACFVSSSAAAALTEVDDLTLPASPDGFNLTVDDVTGLEWLDLTVTAGRTYDDIVGNDGTDELGPGGDFEGFRYATDLEVSGWINGPQQDSLFSNFGMTSTFASIGGFDIVRSYMAYLGCQGSCGTFGFIQGLALDDLDSGQFVWFKAEAGPSQGSMFGSLGVSLDTPQMSLPTNGSSSSFGHFLVRAVPEPGVALALALGTASLAGLSGRRSRAAVVRERRTRPRSCLSADA